MTAGLTGRDPNANVNVLRRFRSSLRKQPSFFAPALGSGAKKDGCFHRLFSLRTKSLTLIYIYRDCNAILLDFFLLSGYV